MDEFEFEDMAMSLVCVLDKSMVTEILLGEQWSQDEINRFIEHCET